MNTTLINNVIYSKRPTYGVNMDKFTLAARPVNSNLDELFMWTPGYEEPRRMSTGGRSLNFEMRDVMEAFRILFGMTAEAQPPVVQHQVQTKPAEVITESKNDRLAIMLLNNPNAGVATLERVIQLTNSLNVMEKVMCHPLCSEEMSLRIVDMLSGVEQEPIVQPIVQPVAQQPVVEDEVLIAEPSDDDYVIIPSRSAKVIREEITTTRKPGAAVKGRR